MKDDSADSCKFGLEAVKRSKELEKKRKRQNKHESSLAKYGELVYYQ